VYFRKDNTTLVVQNEQQVGAHKIQQVQQIVIIKKQQSYNTQIKQADNALV
jgi:hypothetical protein